jgi:DNA-binding SARP family transcriptional activator
VTEFRIQLLGPVRAWRDGAAIDVGSPQQQAVLAMLLLARGEQISTASVIDALWGESPPRSAMGVVRTYISRLRHSFGAGEPDRGLDIEFAGDGYALPRTDLVVDLDVFEQRVKSAVAAAAQDAERARSLCRSALELWRGTPLAGVTGPYADAVRFRTIELRVDAAEIELAAQVEGGGHLGAIAGIRALINHHPLRESLHELLMLALYRAGRPAAALEAYEEARRILRDELGIDPGPGLRRMQQQVLTADEQLTLEEAPQPQRQPAASRLPADLSDFTGRAGLLDAVRTQFAQLDAPRVATLRGMPGIGKTSLAVRAGHLLAPSFPDGQIYLNVTGPGDISMPEHAILTALLRSAGLAAEEIPADSGSRAWAWRELLANREMLIVLDEVASVDQVRTVLVAPPGCAFIVVSRNTLIGLSGARCHEVVGLTSDEALALLETLIGAARVSAERQAAEALVARCAGHPLAVRALGARLAARPDWGLEPALRHFRQVAEPRMRDALLSDANSIPLERAYRRLSPEQALVFRSGAEFEGPWIPVGAAAGELGMPENTVHALFESLADVHLVRPGKWGSYGYDPVIKLFARGVDGSPVAVPGGMRPRIPCARQPLPRS